MDKRLIENNRVKKNIEEALFTLLQNKPFSEITVSDIVKTANVARASYYRNFENKEAIIESYMVRQRKEIAEKIHFTESIDDLFIQEKLKTSLEHYLIQKHYILSLYDNGFGTLILEELNIFAEEILGDMSSHSLERYRLYFLSGAMFNMTIQWLKNGASESPNEMAVTFIKFLKFSNFSFTDKK